jgi:membrane protein
VSTIASLARHGAASIHGAAKVVFDAVVRFLNDNSLIYAGYIAYIALFALFPFIIFLTALGSVLGQGEAAARFIDYMVEGMPYEVASTLEPAIEEITREPRTGLLTISIVITLWFASNGVEALRYALNEAYNVEETRPFWRARLESLALTVLLSAGAILSMVAIIAGPFIWALLEWVLIVPSFYGWLYGVSRFAFGLVVLYAVISLLYFILPNRSLRKREVFPGAALAVAIWVLTASLFSLYLQSLAQYSLTYGSLGGIVVTLLFFYISACIFIFGAQINAAWRRRDVARRAHAAATRTERMTTAMVDREPHR